MEERTATPPVPTHKNSILKATPIVQPTAANKPPVIANKMAEKKIEENDDDDDDDVRSGVNQPVSQAIKQKTPASPIPNNNNGAKELTPKERLLLNKLKKADEEAAKVG